MSVNTIHIKSFEGLIGLNGLEMYENVVGICDDGRKVYINNMRIEPTAEIKVAELNQYAPDKVSSPGETLKEILAEKNWSVVKFADKTGLTEQEAHKLLKGRMSISEKLADRLGEVLGTDKDFWLTRNSNYKTDFERRLKEKNEQKVRKTKK